VVLKVLVLENILFQFQLLLVFDLTDPLLVFDVLLLLFDPHLIYALICRDLRNYARLALESVKLLFSHIVLRLIGNAKDKANNLYGFKDHDRIDDSTDHIEFPVELLLSPGDLSIGITSGSSLQVAKTDQEEDTQANGPDHSKKYEEAGALAVNLIDACDIVATSLLYPES
jgi:hypothetical protein